MAGSYPNVPSRRMAWDIDGTVCGMWSPGYTSGSNAGLLYELSDQYYDDCNSEQTIKIYPTYFSGAPGGYIFSGNTTQHPGMPHDSGAIVWLFPELREVDGFLTAFQVTGTPEMYTLYSSGDTTDGVNGTWSLEADPDTLGGIYNVYRTTITTLNLSNKRGLRAWMSFTSNFDEQWNGAHIYGTIAAGETPDRLLYVDATSGLEFTLPFDYGDVARGSARDSTFKLKNNSGSLTAASVQLTTDSLYLGSNAWYTMSEGGAFQSTLPLAASIGSGASSPTITLRQNIPDTANLGLHAARVRANVGSWA